MNKRIVLILLIVVFCLPFFIFAGTWEAITNSNYTLESWNSNAIKIELKRDTSGDDWVTIWASDNPEGIYLSIYETGHDNTVSVVDAMNNLDITPDTYTTLRLTSGNKFRIQASFELGGTTYYTRDNIDGSGDSLVTDSLGDYGVATMVVGDDPEIEIGFLKPFVVNEEDNSRINLIAHDVSDSSDDVLSVYYESDPLSATIGIVKMLAWSFATESPAQTVEMKWTAADASGDVLIDRIIIYLDDYGEPISAACYHPIIEKGVTGCSFLNFGNVEVSDPTSETGLGTFNLKFNDSIGIFWSFEGGYNCENSVANLSLLTMYDASGDVDATNDAAVNGQYTLNSSGEVICRELLLD